MLGSKLIPKGRPSEGTVALYPEKATVEVPRIELPDGHAGDIQVI